MNRVFKALFYRYGKISSPVMRPFFRLVRPLLRASGKDKTMKRPPKTPVEFDYDLWTTEDGRCMVRVKATGEAREVDREVMKALRNEEKKLRRSMTGVPIEGAENGETATLLSLDYVSCEGCEDMSPGWLIDPKNNIEDAVTQMCIENFHTSLNANQKEVFESVMLGSMSVREYARQKGVNHKTVYETVLAIRKKFKKYF